MVKDILPNPGSSSADTVSSSPAYSASSPSFSSFSSPSTSCAAKQVNVDFILFPTSIINYSPQPVNEPILSNNVQLPLKCEESDVDLIADNVNLHEQCIKESNDKTLKDCLDDEIAPEMEKNDCSVILSNNGRCSISECECTDDSLLLIKIGENSYAGVCANHSVSTETEISELNLNCVENLTLTTVDSKCLGVDVTDSNNSLGLMSSFSSVNLSQSPTTSIDDQNVFNASPPDKGIESSLTLDSTDQQTMVMTECNQSNVTDALLLPLPHPEGLKSVSGEVDETETNVPSAEIDTGMPSLSSHIDDSFHLAQLEVVCQICDEQFLCMDTFITHMECIHK